MLHGLFHDPECLLTQHVVKTVIDGQRHQSKLVKINDGMAAKYIKETYPWVKFVRLSKLDCIHENVEERIKYFQKMFGLV